MEGSGFLKTVNFGGFDKKDVLSYIKVLNEQINTLEAELSEKVALLEDSGGAVGSEKYEKLLAADKAKIAELQTDNDTLKNQVISVEGEFDGLKAENDELKAKIASLEDELVEANNKASAGGTNNEDAIDLGNVFIEAQKTATIIVTQAKENARKMDEDAKKLATQVIDDANGKASTIVKKADDKAIKLLTEAEDKSYEMRTTVDNLKNLVTEEFTEIEENIANLKEVLEMFSSESLSRLNETKTIIEGSYKSLNLDIDAAKSPAPALMPEE